MGMNLAQRMMMAGMRRRRMIPAVTAIFQEGFSVPARSAMEAPVMRMAMGKAPMPIMEMVERGAPVMLSSSLSATSSRAVEMAMMGPFRRCFHGMFFSPERIMTPTDQMAISTPMLWTKRSATAELPQRISTTGTARKP